MMVFIGIHKITAIVIAFCGTTELLFQHNQSHFIAYNRRSSCVDNEIKKIFSYKPY